VGITWFIHKSGPITYYGHGGATHGQQAIFMYVPEKEFALAILTNSDEGGILNNKATNTALELYFNAKIELPKPAHMPSSELKEYTGFYRIGTEAFDLKMKDGFLVYHHIPLGGFPTPDTSPGPAMPLMRFSLYKKDLVIGLDEPMKGAFGDFIRDEKGKLKYLRVGGRAHKKISRLENHLMHDIFRVELRINQIKGKP
jgi:hypothetical protein